MNEGPFRGRLALLLASGMLLATAGAGCRSPLTGEWLRRTTAPPPHPSGVDRLDYPEICLAPSIPRDSGSADVV